ncbi:Hypothetical protein MVR_LOCUS213 [uncultured virus]|nr:Hypothetical protein MVR_LOCUS213 [uncultured virus]
MLLQITRCDSTCKQLYDYIITLEDWLRTAQVEVDGEQSALGHPHITKAWRPERRWKNGPLWIAQNIDIIVPTDEAGIVTVPITRYGRPYACRTMRKSSQTLPHLEEILCKGIHTSFSLYIKGFWMCYGCRGLTISLARLDTGIQLFPLERPIYNLKALKKAYEPTTAEITDTVQPVEIEI